MNRPVRTIYVIVAFVAVMAFAQEANAVTGAVSGVWKFWNKNGNYCPSSNTCTGAVYPQSMYDTVQPVAFAAVWVIDTSGAIIGSGSTDSAGNYTVSWTRSTFPSQIGVYIFPYQKDARFYLADTAGTLVHNWFGLVTTASSSSPTSPQYVGYYYVGTSAAPDPYYNAYWAAQLQWLTTMQQVSVLVSNFTNVEVRGFADNIPGFQNSCPTSCAWGPVKHVQLDSNAGFSPQARVMHELGHIASYVTHPWQITTNYSWGGSGGWSYTSPEYGDAAFEEAFATHYGSVTLWSAYSVQPTSCISSATCYTSGGTPYSGTDLEASSFPYSVNNCDTSSNEARWPISTMRYLWDVFDQHNDADGDSYSASQGDFWKHLYNLAWYPEGTGPNQINEPWDATLTSETEPDGRAVVSYSTNYSYNVTGTWILAVDNCTPP